MDCLHLTTAHNPVDTRIFNREATTLVENEYEVGIIGHDAPDKPQNGVRFYDLGTVSNRQSRWKNIFQIARRAKALDASVYHFHDPELIPVGIYLSKSTGNKVVYDVHENYGHVVKTREWIPSPVVPSLTYIIPKLERSAATHFDAIVATSEWKAKPFEQSCDKITVAHNFPKVGTIPTDPTPIKRTSENVLCYVGGLVGVRGIFQMLQVINKLDNRDIDIELWALGDWKPDVDRDRARSFINNSNLENKVRFPGYLSYDKMFQYLYSADVGLALLDVNHYKYNIPTKFFEYLYAGLPVVTTPVNAVQDYIPEKYRYVVPQNDPKSAADAVENALKADYETKKMRSLVEEKFSWEAEAEDLVALYEDLLE